MCHVLNVRGYMRNWWIYKSCLLKTLLCYFPMAAVTNFHKFSDLKQSQLIVLQFWTSEVQNGSHWMKFKVSVGLCSFCRLWGNPFPCLFQLWEAACIPWLMAPFSIFKASNGWPNLSHIISLWYCLILTSPSPPLLSPSFTYRILLIILNSPG